MFDLYPRHGHRTPQQIAEDTGSSFEPTRPYRRSDILGDIRDDVNGDRGDTRGSVNVTVNVTVNGPVNDTTAVALANPRQDVYPAR